MLPYSRSLFYENNFGVLKAQEYLDFWQKVPENLGFSFNHALNYLNPDDFQKQFVYAQTNGPAETSRGSKTYKKTPQIQKKKPKAVNRSGKKVKKCELKGNKLKLKRKRLKMKYKGMKKYMVPILLGLLVAKSVLTPIVLKGLAIMSAKGFLMGFFSTILASFLTLKGMFDNSNRYQGRNDDKTQLEIVHLPEKLQHHYDEHYLKRTGFDYPSTGNSIAYQVYTLPLQNQFLQYTITPPTKPPMKNRYHIKNPVGIKKSGFQNKVQNVTLVKAENNVGPKKNKQN